MSEIMKFELVNCKNIIGLYENCNLYNVLFWLKKSVKWLEIKKSLQTKFDKLFKRPLRLLTILRIKTCSYFYCSYFILIHFRQHINRR